MTFYNRGDILYIRINSKRISTKLKDTKQNRKLVKSYYENHEFIDKFNLNNNKILLLDLCEDVLIKKEKELKQTSFRSYLSMYKNRIVPYFKDKTIHEIKPIDIKNWYDTFTDKSSIITCEAILKQAFQDAILKELITSTPFLIKKPKLKSSYVINPFTIDEVKIILNHDSDIKNFLAISIFTGLRTGEVCGLQWSDIDFGKETINVNRTRTDGFEHKPKTISSLAEIDLPFEAIEYLKNQQFKSGLKKYVFLNSDGLPYKGSTDLEYSFKKLLKDLDLPTRGIYQTRHTFASLKLSIGERLEWVSFMMRHKSPKTTLDKYYKYMPRKKEKRVLLDLEMTQNRHSSY